MKQKITEAVCRSCGACCVSVGDGLVLDFGFAHLLDKDVEQVSLHVRAQLQEIDVGGEIRYATHAKQLPSGDYACQYLRGTPGSRCSCSIYDTRPQVCRHFRVNGLQCREARLVFETSQEERA